MSPGGGGQVYASRDSDLRASRLLPRRLWWEERQQGELVLDSGSEWGRRTQGSRRWGRRAGKENGSGGGKEPVPWAREAPGDWLSELGGRAWV